MPGTCTGRDIELADLTYSRWEVLVASGSGDGWSRALFLIASTGGVSFNVLYGSHLVAMEVDAEVAVEVYNRIAETGPFFTVDDPESQ